MLNEFVFIMAAILGVIIVRVTGLGIVHNLVHGLPILTFGNFF
jgi:hypothetical protein